MAQPFELALQALIELGAERAVVVELPKPFTLRAAYGFPLEQPWDQQLSLGLLESAARDGGPLLMDDAQSSKIGDRWSIRVAQIRSVICVPFWNSNNQVGGLLYADSRTKTGLFDRHALARAQLCARDLERALYGQGEVPKSPQSRGAIRARPEGVWSATTGGLGPRISHPPSGSLGLRTNSRRPDTPVAPSDTPAAGECGKPRSRSLTVFFRSLATMFTAGLPLPRSLAVLAQNSDDRALGALARRVEHRVSSGSALSSAMGEFPNVFSRFELHLLRVGETTGTLHRVLHDLADHRERVHDTHMRVKNALTYPALVSLLCLAMIVILPPYVLEGQFRLIRQSGQTPPLLTRIVMAGSDFLRSPVGWSLIVLACVCLLGLGLQFSRRASWRAALAGRAQHWRVIGPLLQMLATARFARSLSLMWRSGTPLLQALTLAAQTTENPVLEAGIPAGIAALKDGAGLGGSLQATDFFPAAFLQLVRAAEETGKVDTLIGWVAGLYEQQLETNLETFVTLIEPILMMAIGIFVGVLLLATALPMVSLLQNL